MGEDASTHSTPRWVTSTWIVVIALLLLFGSLHLAARTLLGHAFGWNGSHTLPSSATERGPQRP